MKDPLADEPSEMYVLIETTGSNEDHDKQKLENFLEKITTSGLVTTGTMANNKTEVCSLLANWEQKLNYLRCPACGQYEKTLRVHVVKRDECTSTTFPYPQTRCMI